MKRIDTPDGRWSQGNKLLGIKGTMLDAEWNNHVQEELAGILAEAGVEPDAGDMGQVIAALRMRFAVDTTRSQIIKGSRYVSNDPDIASHGASEGDDYDKGNLKKICNDMVGRTGGIVVPEGVYDLDGKTVETPQGVGVTIRPGVLIKNGTLLIRGSVSAMLEHWIDASLTIIFGPGSVEGLYLQWFGVKFDAETDNSAALARVSVAAAAMAQTVSGSGCIIITIGIVKFLQDWVVPKGVDVIGRNWRSAILWYAGTGIGVDLVGAASSIRDVHVTSYDPRTPGHLEEILNVTGTGKIGIRCGNVLSQVLHCTVSYFNDPAKKAKSVEASGTIGFSNAIKHNYIRYCWGGIDLHGVNTDSEVMYNDVARCDKYGYSQGYDWEIGAPTAFVGDNIRVQHNTFQEICHANSGHASVGDGFGMRLARGSVVGIKGNYFEDIWAEENHVSYDIYCDGEEDAKLLGVHISECNGSTSFPGEKYSVYTDHAWYVSDYNNHWGELPKSTANTRYATFGPNFYTGGPSEPFAHIYYTETAVKTIDPLNARDTFGKANHIRSMVVGSTAMLVDRFVNDGDFFRWRRGGVDVGAISVSNGIVSYGSFNGTHWAGFDSSDELLPGTIMSTVDAISQIGGAQLPRVVVSSDMFDQSIYGVYLSEYDSDLAERTINVSSLGAGFIRIHQDAVVDRGDLITSNGDGTGIVQGDDVVRSSTVGKVTSTTRIRSFDDGSYLIPATLHCG